MSSAPRVIDTSTLSGSEPVVGMRKIDTVLEQLSWFLMPTGFIFIILGWVGASRTPFEFEQIPYLISGGLLGLGMMVAGGMLYVGSWVARTAQLVPKDAPISVLANLLQGVALNGASAATATAAPGSFLRTPSGTMFHTADCAIVASRDDLVTVSEKQSDKFKPCGMCDPLAA